MRCFAMGLVGALLISIVAAIIVPQYADYAASAETSSWMHQLQVSKDSIAANAEQHHTLVGSGLGVQHPDFSAHREDIQQGRHHPHLGNGKEVHLRVATDTALYDHGRVSAYLRTNHTERV